MLHVEEALNLIQHNPQQLAAVDVLVALQPTALTA